MSTEPRLIVWPMVDSVARASLPLEHLPGPLAAAARAMAPSYPVRYPIVNMVLPVTREVLADNFTWQQTAIFTGDPDPDPMPSLRLFQWLP